MMLIERPGLYLRIDPLRLTSATAIGNELVLVDFALDANEAADLGTKLLALSAIEQRQQNAQNETQRDLEFLKGMKVSLE